MQNANPLLQLIRKMHILPPYMQNANVLPLYSALNSFITNPSSVVYAKCESSSAIHSQNAYITAKSSHFAYMTAQNLMVKTFTFMPRPIRKMHIRRQYMQNANPRRFIVLSIHFASPFFHYHSHFENARCIRFAFCIYCRTQATKKDYALHSPS